MRFFRLCVLGASCLTLHAQPPAIAQNGIFNSASRIPAALPGGALARGSKFIVEGVRLTGARVYLKHDERSILLPVVSTAAGQLEVAMPASAPPGPASLIVETAAGASKPAPVRIVASQPGLYAINGKGWGPGKIDQFDASDRRSANMPQSPAQPGQIVEIAATGIGEPRAAQIVIGGRSTPALRFERASIRIRIPNDAPRGCYVPLYARIPGAQPSNTVTIAIADRNANCDLPEGWPRPPVNGRTPATIGVARTVTTFGTQPAITTDQAFAGFGQDTQANRLLLVPPAGTCTAYSALYHVDSGESLPAALAGHTPTLDAGKSLTIFTAAGSRMVPRSGAAYGTRLGSHDPSLRRNLPLLLNDPRYTLTAPGGTNVPPFSATIPGLPSLDWIDPNVLSTIDRARGASVEWRSAPDDAIILILAASFDFSSTTGTVAYCASKPDADRFLIPSEILQQFPATGTTAGPTRSGIALIAVRLQPQTPVPQLDLKAAAIFVLARTADYR